MKIFRNLIDSPLILFPMMIKRTRITRIVNSHLLARKTPSTRRLPIRKLRSQVRLGAKAIATQQTLLRINLRTRTRMTFMRSR